MTDRNDAFDQYLRNRAGKRITVPSQDVSYYYQSQRKRWVRVEKPGQEKYLASIAERPFYRFRTGEAAIQNTIPMRVSKKRIGNEKKQQSSLGI
jgi:hypothetical protein